MLKIILKYLDISFTKDARNSFNKCQNGGKHEVCDFIQKYNVDYYYFDADSSEDEKEIREISRKVKKFLMMMNYMKKRNVVKPKNVKKKRKS